MLLKVKLSQIPADMLRQGDCFCLQSVRPTVLYTVTSKSVINGGSIGVNVISLPDSKAEYWALDASLAVYLISPKV